MDCSKILNLGIELYRGYLNTGFICLGLLFRLLLSAHYEENVSLALLQLYSSSSEPTEEKLIDVVCRKAVPACGSGVVPMTLAREVGASITVTLSFNKHNNCHVNVSIIGYFPLYRETEVRKKRRKTARLNCS